MADLRPALLAIDVDGTLLNSRHEVDDSAKTAIEGLAADGVIIVVASSRGPTGISVATRGLRLPGMWVAAFQGALVYSADVGPEAPISESEIGAHTSDAVAAAASGHNMSVGRYSGSQWFVNTVNHSIRREASITGETPIAHPAIHSIGEPAHKLQFIGNDRAALRGLAESLPPACEGVFSHPEYLEVVAAGTDKAAAVRDIADHLGVDQSRVAAIGDGDNDIGLLSAAPHSVAMGNATTRLKACARWVVSDNDNGGIDEAVRIVRSHLGLG